MPPTQLQSDDIAILHDRLVNHGGAEQVAFELARTFDAPIIAGIVDEEIVPDDIGTIEAFPGRVGQRAMQSHYLVQDCYQMQAWQHVEEAHEYDTLIINKTNPGWYVPKDRQTTVWYLHSTPRGLYDQFHRDGGHWATRVLKTPMRPLYAPNTRYADAWACNSELVQRRMERYWDVPRTDSDVIYPPVDVSHYSPDHATTGDFYFTFSRLRGHKCVDEIIDAFNQLHRDPDQDYQLLVGGDGPARDELEEMAGPNVEFLGYVSEAEKARLLSEAKAGIFAAENEDFGMVPIEFMAAGTPVLGVRDGYTQHQVLDGKNGLLFSRQGGHLRERIRMFERHGVEWSGERIAGFAERFSADRFRSAMRVVVAQAQRETAVTVPWEQAQQEAEDVADVDPLAELRADGGDQ